MFDNIVSSANYLPAGLAGQPSTPTPPRASPPLFPWYSTRDGDFTYDLHVMPDPSRAAAVRHNYKSLDELHADGWTDADPRGDWPGASVFLRRGDEVFHIYSAYARGLAAGTPHE